MRQIRAKAVAVALGVFMTGAWAASPAAVSMQSASSPVTAALAGAPSWPGWDIARGAALLPDGTGGYVLDGWGGIHPFGGAPRTSGAPYWRGWDIARDIALLPDGTGGYVLDGWGGIHPIMIPQRGDAGPLRAAFYYPWFPGAWRQGGVFPYTNFQPSAGTYDGNDAQVVREHIAAMQHGYIGAGIASWWGPGSSTDAHMPMLLRAAAGTEFRWTVYDEAEGQGNPSPAQISTTLTYLRDHYAHDPGYLRRDGRFVVFVYADATDACGMADRWAAGNTVGAYVVLKVFPGYQSCASQPDEWHQYGPASAMSDHAPHSYTISPGFWKVGESPRLARDPARFARDAAAMNASGAALQLVTTFNEWGEGTAIEAATEWASASRYGVYLDALHAVGPPVSRADPCGTTSVVPARYQHVVWIWLENHRYSEVIGSPSAPYLTRLARDCTTATDYAVVGDPSLPNYVGATAGQTFGIADDSPPSSHPITANNLFRQVRNAGGTARSYLDAMPSRCALTSSGTYAVKHNPAAYFTGAGDRTACASDDRPLTEFDPTHLPTFAFIAPDLCHDSHDCSTATADEWLAGFLPTILTSPAYLAGTTAVVVTYDEYTPMPNAFIAPAAVPGTRLTARMDHYALLRATEEMLGLPLLANAASAAPVRGALGI